MAAPKGNQFWRARSSHGRKPKFESSEELWNACVEYFKWVEDNPLYEPKPFAFQGEVQIVEVPKMRAMTVGGLCVFLDIGLDTWVRYRGREDLGDVTTRVDMIIREQKFTGAAAELLNPNIIARDLGLPDKREHGSSDDSGIVVNVVGMDKVLSVKGVKPGEDDTDA